MPIIMGFIMPYIPIIMGSENWLGAAGVSGSASTSSSKKEALLAAALFIIPAPPIIPIPPINQGIIIIHIIGLYMPYMPIIIGFIMPYIMGFIMPYIMGFIMP